MEPLTHFLLGGTMARAGLNGKSPLATVTLVVAAEAADLEGLAAFGGRTLGARGIPHSLVATPLIAGLVVLVMWLRYGLWGRPHWPQGRTPPRWRTLWGLAWLAALSHVLLDFTNSYGVRPFEPFSYRWYSWDIVFWFEPVLWLILLGGLLLPSLIARVNDQAPTHRLSITRQRAGATIALVMVLAFWSMRDYQHRRAVAALQVVTCQGEQAMRISAYPYYINPFRWYGVVETRNFYDSMIVNSRTGEVDPYVPPVVRHKPEETPVTLAAKRSRLAHRYLEWAKYPMTETERINAPGQGYLVRIYDVRFRYPDDGGRGILGGSVKLDPKLNVTGDEFGVLKFPAASQPPSAP